MNAFEYIGKEKIKETIESSNSIKEVIKKVGLEPTSNHRTFNKFIKKFSLEKEVEELKKRSYKERSKRLIDKRFDLITLNDFCKNSSRTTGDIKKYIIKNNLLEYKCFECGIGNVYNNKPLTLQLHHINGDNTDNRLENLKFLCPNCHTQTETYGSKNIKSFKETRKLKEEKIALENQERKKDALSLDLTKRGWVSALSKKWGITRKSVRKWFKQNMPEVKLFDSTSKDITPEILKERKKQKEEKIKIKNDELLRLQKILKESNIDFSKRGWQTELGLLWGKDRRTAAEIFYRNFSKNYENIYKHKKY